MQKYILISLIFLIGLGAGEVFSYRDNYIENHSLTARGLAMGGAASAVLDNPDGILLNPASMIGINKYRITVKNEPALADVSRLSIMSIMPIDAKNIWSAGYTKIAVGNIKIAEDTGTELLVKEKANYSESAIFLGYAYKVDNALSLGITGKHYENILNVSKEVYENANAAGNDVDLGLLYRVNNDISVGAGFKNCGSSIDKKGALLWGNSYQESFDFGPYLGVSQFMPEANVLLALDVRASKLYKNIISAGVEYKMFDLMAVRAGYNSRNNLSMGLGIDVADLLIDYAYILDYGTAADNRHFVSLGYSFNTAFVKTESVAEIKNEIKEVMTIATPVNNTQVENNNLSLEERGYTIIEDDEND